MAQKPVLGKGLASLFPGVAASPTIPNAPIPSAAGASSAVIGGELVSSNGVNSGAGAVSAGPATTVQQQEISRDRHPGISLAIVDEIHANPYQPRRDFDDAALEELSQSIRANGIIQPLVVRKRPQGGYELIAGERRLRAAKLAGVKHVPIVIRRTTDRESLELALVENIQRQDLNCIDTALALSQLIQDFSMTQEEAAVRVGKDRATVANHIRLLRLPEAIIDDLKRGILTFGHGKALLAIEDNDARLQIRAQVIEKRLSVRDTESLVDQLKQAGNTPAGKPNIATEVLSPLKARMAALAQELTRHWSTRVEVRGSERRGKIVIHYSSRQELDRVLEAMKN